MQTWTTAEPAHNRFLTIDPLHIGILYAYEAGYLIKSEDFGDNWNGLTTVAGFGPVNIIPGTHRR